MIGIKKRVFLCGFQKSIKILCEKMFPKKVNIKKLQPLCFMWFSSSVTLFRGVFINRHAILHKTN
jgi:hypothetical protein